MWVIKARGETFYVNHVDCNVPWSTKETPDNPSTKGSIKVKDCLLTIDDNNCATITKLSIIDKHRLANQESRTRIITNYASEMHTALIDGGFKHSKLKTVSGGCGAEFVICDLLDKREVTFAALKYNFRILMPNEEYYKAYDRFGPIYAIEEDEEDEHV